MFTYTQVEEQLKTSKWSEQSISTLSPVLPRLGKWALAFVWQQLNSTGSYYEADEVAEVISQEPVWYAALQKADNNTVGKATQQIIDSGSQIKHKALLAIILDIRGNKPIAALVSKQLSQLFDQVEITYLVNVPPSEVAAILSGRISSFINLVDLPMEIKRYCYYKDSLESDDIEVIKFKQALENNTQLIGADPKSVKEWIRDFIDTKASAKNRSTYDVAQYITGSSTVAKLGDQERTVLLDILILYSWLFQPYTTAEEIESYEKQREEHLAELFATPEPVKIEPVKAQPYRPPLKADTQAVDKAFRSIPKSVDLPVIPAKLSKPGVVIDPTNIVVDEEQRRLAEERKRKSEAIARKLTELKSRNQ